MDHLFGLAMNGINILWAALGLGLVIFLHELGHFAVAKWCNVHVERFSIGFGPIIISRKWGETEYALSWIPFGGYVKMLGQDDADPSQMTSEEIAADPRSYVAKNVWQRMAIISAGVTMNVLTGILFFAGAFGIGLESLPPVVGEVRPGMPAWVSGIDRGDVVTGINGRPVTSYRDLQLSVAVSSRALEIQGTHRDGRAFQATVEPDTGGTRPQIGILPSAGLTLAAAEDRVPPVETGWPADRATQGFESGDTIVSVGGQSVATLADFQELLVKSPDGKNTITVRRGGKTETVDISVQSTFFRTLGLRLDTGPITAVQAGSPADKAGLKAGDKLAKINGRDIGTEIDPLRLPDELAALHGQAIPIIVTRPNPKGGHEEVSVTLTPVNRPGWVGQTPIQGEPLAIPAIGVTFHVVPFVLQVDADGPAKAAGVTPNSAIQRIELILPAGKPKDGHDAPEWAFSLVDSENSKLSQNFSFAFWMLQHLPNREVRLTITEKDQPQPRVVTIIPREDPTWLLPKLGLYLQPLTNTEKANSIGQALSMAWMHTKGMVQNIYLTLNSLITQRLSYKELHGPLGIAEAAYHSARVGIEQLLFFLGFLSLNLAVLNFLPIPVLDGGHMCFLIWEAITGRRPSDKVLIFFTYLGMLFLLGLMALVIGLDLFVHLPGGADVPSTRLPNA